MSSLYDEYSALFSKQDSIFRSKRLSGINDYNIDSVFLSPHSTNFIKYFYFSESLVKLIINTKFEGFRDKHTVSAFLLGILLKDKLKLSTKKLPKVGQDSKDSFLYFWSMISLSHDLTFWMETTDQFYDTAKTIDGFVGSFSLKHNLLEKSRYSNLISSYYQYKSDVFNQMDHGITCGLILYDFLMKDYEHRLKIKKEAAIIISSDDWKFSNDYPKHALTICETIARHNMWVADDKNVKEYEKYGLYDLIPTTTGFHKVAYSENESLLFLLGLVDTLEPVKCLLKDNSDIDVYDLIKNISIEFNHRKKRLTISSGKYITEEIINKWLGISEWLNAQVVKLDNGVDIIFEYQKDDLSSRTQIEKNPRD